MPPSTSPSPLPTPPPPLLYNSYPACLENPEHAKPPTSGPLHFSTGFLHTQSNASLLLEIQVSRLAVGNMSAHKHSTFCPMKSQLKGGMHPQDSRGHRITSTLPQTLLPSASSHRTLPSSRTLNTPAVWLILLTFKLSLDIPSSRRPSPIGPHVWALSLCYTPIILNAFLLEHLSR